MENFAHIVGEHQEGSAAEIITHILLSWAGTIIAATITAVALYFVYKSFKLNTEREKHRK